MLVRDVDLRKSVLIILAPFCSGKPRLLVGGWGQNTVDWPVAYLLGTTEIFSTHHLTPGQFYTSKCNHLINGWPKVEASSTKQTRYPFLLNRQSPWSMCLAHASSFSSSRFSLSSQAGWLAVSCADTCMISGHPRHFASLLLAIREHISTCDVGWWLTRTRCWPEKLSCLFLP